MFHLLFGGPPSTKNLRDPNFDGWRLFLNFVAENGQKGYYDVTQRDFAYRARWLEVNERILEGSIG